MAITTDYILKKIERILKECYEPNQFHELDINPRFLKSSGTLNFRIMGIPKENALDTFNEIMTG